MTAVPRKAATVVIVRDPAGGESGIEILMLLRSPDDPFVPSCYVFPGGAVDPEDFLPDELFFPAGPGPSPDRTLLVTAVRETFEESGILLAVDRGGGPVMIEPVRRSIFERYRRRLAESSIGFGEMLAREGMRIPCGALECFSRWVTPEFSPIRYDAYFFIARSPRGGDAVPDGKEVVDHVWISPEDAIARSGRGEFRLALPTLQTLKEIAGYRSVEDALESISSKNASPDSVTSLPFLLKSES